MRNLFLFFSFFICGSVFASTDWTHSIDNYTRSDYKAGSQNWDIMQHSNGWMYFGNKMGVLEFNGKDWKLYPINNQSDVRCILKSADNKRIYVGGVNELGYLEPKVNGELVYHCISSELPRDDVNFGNIWSIFEKDRSVYFCADQVVVRLTDGKLTTLQCPDKIDCSSLLNSTLYVGTDSGIYMLTGDVFFKIPGMDLITNKKIRGIRSLGDKMLIVTALDGLFLWDKDGVRPFHTQADDFIKKNEIFSIAINDKQIAIGTVLKGVVLLTDKGDVTSYFNESHGLYNNTVLSLFFDKENNLWLGLDNGIAYIALSNPVTNLYVPPNFYGAGYAAALYNGKLYLGTNRGLFYIDWPIPLQETAPELKLVENMKGQVWSLTCIDDQLICCLDKGLFIMKGNEIQDYHVGIGVWKCVLTNQDKNKAWLSTYNGFYMMERENGKWKNPKPVHNFYNSIINFEESKSGALWVRNSWDEIFKLTLDDSFDKVVQKDAYTQKNIPLNPYIYKINDQIELCSQDGFYTFNEKENRFISDDNLNSLLKCQDNIVYKSLYENKKDIWVLGPSSVGVYFSNSKHFFSCRHNIPLITNFEHLVLLNDLSAIICNENGFALWTVDPQYTGITEANMQIVRVDITKPLDSLIYINNYNSVKIVPEVAYKNNSLRFTYGLLRYSDKSEIMFRCKLDDENWTEYSTQTFHDCINVGIGKHTFKVETKRTDGSIFSDEFVFVILPPWYSTTTAYIIYIALFIVFIFGLWYWDDRRIKRKEKRVEAAQQEEMREKEELYKKESARREQEIVELKNEHLELEVKHKNQELANIAINLTGKNEVLADIKGDLNRISEKMDPEKLDVIALRRMILLLSNKIDDNILQDDSLKKFEEHFDLVHNNFMQRLLEKYPTLTLNERKMCAFIKMHLSSKEIAPILNITIRGAETLRYRLRKKFELGKDESLTLFLNSF